LAEAQQIAIEFRTTADELASHVDLCAEAVSLIDDANEHIAEVTASSGRGR
jgi:hypothetical protein